MKAQISRNDKVLQQNKVQFDQKCNEMQRKHQEDADKIQELNQRID